MRFAKSMMVLLLIGVSLAAGLYVAINRGLLSESALAHYLPTLDRLGQQVANSPLSQDATHQLGILSNRAGVVGEHSSSILGASVQSYVQESDHQPSLQQRAFEYGRYLYCQQVIQDYEQRP